MLVTEAEDYKISAESSVRDVVAHLTNSGLLLALAVETDDFLVGLVTDGDIRRGLLAGAALEDPLTKIMNADFVSAPTGTPHYELLELAETLGAMHIPLVDARNRLISVAVQNPNAPAAKRLNTVFVMAGGEGKRLRPLTANTPKPMIHIAGKPMLLHLLERLRSEGFVKFVFSTNYLSSEIEKFFGDGSSLGVEITYVTEPKPLGTAGSLSLLSYRPAEPLIVINADVVLEAKVSAMVDYHQDVGAEITVGVKMLESQIPFGVVELNGAEITAIVEKPFRRDFVNAGVYVLAPDIPAGLAPAQRLDMTDLLAAKIGNRKVKAFPIHEEWIDMGSLDELKRATTFLSPSEVGPSH